MPKSSKKKITTLPKTNEIKFDKISVFYKRPILKSILKILTMEHSGFRTFKSVKNINRLFANLDLKKYQNHQELLSFIWCISYISKEWLSGVVSPDIIIEMAKRQPDFDNIKNSVIEECINDPNIVTPPEAKMIFDLIAEALQLGFVGAVRDEYITLLEDIDLNDSGAFRVILERLFMISQSLLDIKHNTNLVANKVTFNTADIDSVKEALSSTIESLSVSNNMFKVGIRRWNTLLSPAYMNGRLYTYIGAPGSGKSLILLKTALDIRKYNPDYQPRTPGMRSCVLYITMENSFTETIERIWNMTFDDPITNYSVDEATDILCNELGITRILKDDVVVTDLDTNERTLADLIKEPDESNKSNIELVIKYFSYREINTDDLFTIISDLRDENMEVCTLVFDYIKRIEPATPAADNVKLELNRIINELKALAVREDIPVVTAHQMNRAGAAVLDNAVRQGKGDGLKNVGREHTGDAWEVIETSDFVAMTNIAYKPGTDDRYMELEVVKRRRIDSSESEFAKYTYLAHPFSKKNGLRLIDDINIDKVLSLQSLVSDIDIIDKEKANAVPRLQTIKQSEFVDLDEY